MKLFMFIVLSIVLLPAMHGLDITLSDGSLLSDVTVESVSLRGILLMYHAGGKNVKPDQLSESAQESLAQEIAQYNQLVSEQKERNRILAERRAAEQKAQEERRAAEQKAQEEKKKQEEEQIRSQTDNLKKVLDAFPENASEEQLAVLQKAIENNPMAKNLKRAQSILKDREKEIHDEAYSKVKLEFYGIQNMNWDISIEALEKLGATLRSEESDEAICYQLYSSYYWFTKDKKLRSVGICLEQDLEPAILNDKLGDYVMKQFEYFKQQNISCSFEYYKGIGVITTFCIWLEIPGNTFVTLRSRENLSQFMSNSIFIHAYNSRYFTKKSILGNLTPMD